MGKFKGYTKRNYIYEFDLHFNLEAHERVNKGDYLLFEAFQPGEEKRLQKIAKQIETLEELQKEMVYQIPLTWKEEYIYLYQSKTKLPFKALIKQLIEEMEDYCEIDEEKYEEEVSFQKEHDNWENEEYKKEQQTRY